MKPLRKSIFLCYGKNQVKLRHKSCRKEQLLTSYLLDEKLCSNIYTLEDNDEDDEDDADKLHC